jgi:hypothetical protein
VKNESKLKLQKKGEKHQNNVPPKGDKEWELGAPLILLMRLQIYFLFTKFYKCLLKKGVLPRVLDAPNPLKMDRVSSYLFADLHKTEIKK